MAEVNLIEHLSGGNHELFHSNFLAYIAQVYPDFFKEIISIDDTVSEALKCFNPSDCKVLRERQHFDFAIADKDSERYLLVLENKMKSLPDMDQLESYKEKAEADCRILLTMIKVPDEELTPGWIQLSYSELADRMENALKNRWDCFFNFLVRPYIDYIRTISNDIDVIKSEFDKAYDNKKISDYLVVPDNNDETTPKWQSLFLKKVRFQLLSDKIRSGYGKDILCSAGIVRGYLPFIDLNPYDKKHYKAEVNKFWLQIYPDHIEQGFYIYYERIKEKRKSNKPTKQEERIRFFRKIWKAFLKEDKDMKRLIKTINDKEILGVPFPVTEKEIEVADFKGYIYKDFVMIYLRSSLPEINIDEFVNRVRELICLVRDNDKKINELKEKEKENNNKIKQ